ncbi:hypothetical protein GDO81_021426 [Engystomops pustulosus]|uniref:Telomeric repeat-binding factor 2-interacting protein 1 n=1 Tax=Engystomops pustulosus TaxID=76066 RepID=A0AAV6ZTF2_ENGPU|nr:hypothetical protein GDO81_021426 [Engystomops pustulosus]
MKAAMLQRGPMRLRAPGAHPPRTLMKAAMLQDTSQRGSKQKRVKRLNLRLIIIPNPWRSTRRAMQETPKVFDEICKRGSFEVEDEDCCPGISLRDLVMGEDSEMRVVSPSPALSDMEGLQEALVDMMQEFGLDLCRVTQVLLKNSGEVGSTRHFLRTGCRPDGFPVWTQEDDVQLQRNEPALRAGLARKYGADNVAKRAAFLAS